MRTLNVRLAAILLAIVIVSGVGVFFLHKFQVRRNVYVFRDQADAAEVRMGEAAKAGDVEAEREAFKDMTQSLGWYTLLKPEDADAAEKLGMAIADRAVGRRDFDTACARLDVVLRLAPERDKVRRRLVDILMSPMERRYRDAKQHLEEFLLKAEPENAELWELLAQSNVELADYDAAVQNFQKAIEIDPKRVESYARLADVLHSHAFRDKDADESIAKMLEVNPQSGRAHFLAARYFHVREAGDEKFKAETSKELQKALEISPDDRETLLLATQCSLDNNDVEKAREYASHGIALYPKIGAFYLDMSKIEMRSNDREKAVAVLQDGVKATNRDPEVLMYLANLLITVNDLPQARRVVDDLKSAGLVKAYTDYLEARMAFAQGNWLQSRQGLEKARAAFAMMPALVKEMDMWIAQCYAKLGNRDQQMEAFRHALKIDPMYAPARLGMSQATLATGKVDDALAEYNQLRATTGGKASPIPYARMLIMRNLQLPADERNWKSIEAFLDELERAKPGTADVAILRAEVLLSQDRLDEAEELVKKAQEANPKEPALWAVLASLAERRGDWAKTEAMLEEAKKTKGDTVVNRLAEADYLVRRKGHSAADEVRKMLEDEEKFSDADRMKLWNGLLQLSVRVGDTKQVTMLAERIAAKDPNNAQIRYMLFEQALRTDPPDFKAIDEAIKQIENVAGHDAYWYYAQAARIGLAAKDQPNASEMFDKAIEYLTKARESRPTWTRLPLLLAALYDQQGKNDLALKNFREAIDMGEHSPVAVQRTIHLLVQTQQLDEASRLLAELEKQQMPFSGEMYQMAAEVALNRGEFDRALEMARKLPLAESKSVPEHIWFGQVTAILGRRLKEQGKTQEAEEILTNSEKALRRAAELEPKNPNVWIALADFYTKGGATEQAAKTIEEAAASVPAEQVPLTQARCYVVMKKNDDAEQKFEAAFAAAPKDPAIIQAVADFYYSTDKLDAAEAKLQLIIDGKVESPKAVLNAARRQLANIYFNRDGYQNRQKARALVEANLASAEASALDRRLQAMLNAADPKRSQRDAAIAGLEAMVREKSATPEDLFKLAQSYLDADDWPKASSTFRSLLSLAGDNPRYVATYMALLIEHQETAVAESYLTRLEKAAPDDIITMAMKAEILAANGKPEEISKLYDEFLDRPNARPTDRNLRVRTAAEFLTQLATRLLKRDQNKEMADKLLQQAETYYRTLADKDPAQKWPLLAFLASQGRFDQALDLLDRNWESVNPVAIAKAAGAILQDGKLDKEQADRLDRVLQAALKQFDRPAILLMALADLRTWQRDYVETDSLYREVLKKNDRNVYAMNNLAVLLALQNRDLDEALKLIDKAIEIRGPIAPMLDSRATVYMALQQPKKAVADMNDVLADAETPVRLFHMAQACDQAGDKSGAEEAMKKAAAKGLTEGALHPLELPSYEKLKALAQ